MIYVNSISDIKVGDKILIAKYLRHNQPEPSSLGYFEVKKVGRKIIYLSSTRLDMRLRLTNPKNGGPISLFVDPDSSFGYRCELFRTKEDFEQEKRINEEVEKLQSAARTLIGNWSMFDRRFHGAESQAKMAEAVAALTAHILEFSNAKV